MNQQTLFWESVDVQKAVLGILEWIYYNHKLSSVSVFLKVIEICFIVNVSLNMEFAGKSKLISYLRKKH